MERAARWEAAEMGTIMTFKGTWTTRWKGTVWRDKRPGTGKWDWLD